MIYDSFDIVIVPFPFSERAVSKRRPALVISNRAFIERHAHVVLAMITSASTADSSPWPSDVAIADPAAAGLHVPSVVRLKVFTIDRALILRRAGTLGASDRKGVAKALDRWLA